MLAAIALCVGTTIIIKMGKTRYAWVTLLPLVWLVTVNMTAGWLKIFSPDPKLGFLAHARLVSDGVAAGRLPAGIASAAAAARMVFNDRLDAGVAAFFLISVVVIITESVRTWVGAVMGHTVITSTEVPFHMRTAPAAGGDD